MTAPRITVAGATLALTRRTVLRKAFLGPWHPLVEQCWLYALADAQRRTGVDVHHSVLVVNHHHTTVTSPGDPLRDFLRRFHRDMSCALHTLLCSERYDAPRELFDDRPTHEMRLMDAGAQASYLVYERLNTAAAGLVERPGHMPQKSLHFGLWKTGFVEVERPPLYFDKHRPERLRLKLTPPPLLYQAFDGDLEKLVYHMDKLTTDGLRAIRAARIKPPMGAKALRRLHPWSEPRTLRESGDERVPTFRIGARDIVGREHRVGCAKEVTAFRHAHRAARIARRDGDLEARFPFGTYAARVFHGAPTELAPPPDAMVCQPGPCLDDIRTQLQAEGCSPSAPAQVLDEVRDALAQEADEILEHADLDLTEPTPVRPLEENTDGDTAEPEPVRVRHRFDRRQRPSARRLIVLRDDRRGHPKEDSPRHGSDPPG